MTTRRRAKRIARLVSMGKTPFNCRHCAEVFASDRDREHHEQDAHLKPQHPAAQAKKESRAMGRHHHQPPARALVDTSKDITTRIFRKKEPDLLYLVDYVTPLDRAVCLEAACEAPAIPLTGRCPEHDLVCQAIMAARVKKATELAVKKAEEEARAASLRDNFRGSSPNDRRFIGPDLPSVGNPGDDGEPKELDFSEQEQDMYQRLIENNWYH